ncbi:hypothetical protein CHLNCDRAFT_141297 [Chlorella variabilis]|uniref:Uncharacterized protein n=1 Tax=Chlorella variabilis TaxID=554065 RepID=E1ZSJ8_CHLVA|nr:hypothetical protein CHLNCDRAFT_141297 [Chlorella variabilis]EFN51167.1 hypothetical protein CHLNCDRAFT_141297 [Chlorella variabilis]|eukprot:XP_005843269.1 hypothetical protein CHLNCDRAFT_141297 [Chlorella variabilis]
MEASEEGVQVEGGYSFTYITGMANSYDDYMTTEVGAFIAIVRTTATTPQTGNVSTAPACYPSNEPEALRAYQAGCSAVEDT